MKNIVKILLAAAAAVVFAGAAQAQSTDQAALEAKAKVSKADAVKTALAKVPGTIEDSSIVQQKDALLWTFNISPKGGKGITVVSVDATTGKIASVTAKKGKKGGKEDDDDDEKDDD
ncbi:MAG TPA: PepSY domain-containing protein [Chthoniobacteraceae bacterium]|nr:PepSY domain-containing protein [Chthoniobacteraceae bacterium]